MLVMRRRAGESFLIGEAIQIEVLEISGTRVKLGIVAPETVPIQRKEIQIARVENIIASLSVRPQDIASLLHKVTSAPTVNSLTNASVLATKCSNSEKTTSSPPGKY